MSDEAKPVEAVANVAAEKPKKSVITPEYVSELRSENKERRTEAQELSKKLEDTSKKLAENEEIAKKAIEQVSVMQAKAHQTMVRAELKVIANRYGLKDIEDVKLADLSAVKVDDNGDVSGVEEAITKLKDKKPYLFESVSTSRADGSMPQAQTIQSNNPYSETAAKVDQMSPIEFEQFKDNWLASIARR